MPAIVVRPEALLSKLTSEFLSKQNPSWFCKLYAVLLNDGTSQKAKQVAADCPIVRLRTGDHVPLRTNGRPSASLPSGSKSKGPTVDPKVLKTSRARQYFEASGYQVPDLTSEVLNRILPKYRKQSPAVNLENHLRHLAKILRTYHAVKDTSALFRELADCRIVLCLNRATGDSKYRLPREAYVWDENLADYFGGNPEAWFMSPDYANATEGVAIIKLYTELGIAKEFPREVCDDGDYRNYHLGEHTRGVDGFRPDWDLDGLDFATSHPSLQASAYIWNRLLPQFEFRISGIVQFSTIQNFPDNKTREELQMSAGGAALKDRPWIPDESGHFCTSKEIGTINCLHETLERKQILLDILSEGASVKRIQAARTLGITPADAAFMNDHKEEYERWKAEIEARSKNRDQVANAPVKDRVGRDEKLGDRIEAAPDNHKQISGRTSRLPLFRAGSARNELKGNLKTAAVIIRIHFTRTCPQMRTTTQTPALRWSHPTPDFRSDDVASVHLEIESAGMKQGSAVAASANTFR